MTEEQFKDFQDEQAQRGKYKLKKKNQIVKEEEPIPETKPTIEVEFGPIILKDHVTLIEEAKKEKEEGNKMDIEDGKLGEEKEEKKTDDDDKLGKKQEEE